MIFVLIIYFLFLLVYAVMSSFILYHLFRYSLHNKDVARSMAFLYVFVSIVILLVTLIFVLRVDWSIGFLRGGL